MAENRKSATQAAARKAARERAAERAAEFRRRQEQLEELAAEYFVAIDAVEGIEEDAAARIAAIRADAQRKVAASRDVAAGIVGRMLDTRVSRDEVAERLGIPVRDVKRPKVATPATHEDQPAEHRTSSEQLPEHAVHPDDRDADVAA